MLKRTAERLLPTMLLLIAMPACIRSVCETRNDCRVGNVCSNGACVAACTADRDCPAGRFCNHETGLCAVGCLGDADCEDGGVCKEHQCWTLSSPACTCLQAPSACLDDINPASPTAATRVCMPSTPPRAAALFFGNVGCSHCQTMFGNLLLIESQLRSEGYDPTLVFMQLQNFTPSGDDVKSTFPNHQGPVLQDTSAEDAWGDYGADWYEVKLVDSHGCMSAFFSSSETANLVSGGELQTNGKLVKEAWQSAMSDACHAVPDGGIAPEVGR